MKDTGKNPIEIMLPAGKKDLKDAPWTTSSGKYTSELFTVEVISNSGEDWVVQIEYFGN